MLSFSIFFLYIHDFHNYSIHAYVISTIKRTRTSSSNFLEGVNAKLSSDYGDEEAFRRRLGWTRWGRRKQKLLEDMDMGPQGGLGKVLPKESGAGASVERDAY